jgi:uncharacterized protein YbcI
MAPEPIPSTPAAHRAAGDVRSAISDGLVALLKEYYGRGPDKAKAYVTDDLVVCLLRGGFTPVEQTLLDGGHGGDVIRQRMAFQDVMRTRFQQVVEHATGRTVIGFMSGNQQHPDMICEVFILAPTTRSARRPRATFESRARDRGARGQPSPQRFASLGPAVAAW